MRTLPGIVADMTDSQIRDVIVGSIVLIAILLVLFGAVMLYRKWMNKEDTPTGPGFTLSDLRRLHKEGKMTAEEFEKAKTVLIGSVKSQADKIAPAGGTAGGVGGGAAGVKGAARRGGPDAAGPRTQTGGPDAPAGDR